MSGGHFNYAQQQVREIAEDIERLIATNGAKDSDGWGHEYPADIIEKFKEAAHALERAADMAQRVDWLVSSDDGEDAFRSRWNSEVRAPWPKLNDDALIIAFVQGAKWWEYMMTGATMWPSDQDQAEGQAKIKAANGTLGKVAPGRSC